MLNPLCSVTGFDDPWKSASAFSPHLDARKGTVLAPAGQVHQLWVWRFNSSPSCGNRFVGAYRIKTPSALVRGPRNAGPVRKNERIINKRPGLAFLASSPVRAKGERGVVGSESRPASSPSLCPVNEAMKQHWTNDHREWYRKVYLNSEHWRDLKRAKLSKNPACERCGSPDRPDVHHVRYRNIFDVKIKDLLTLCRTCHQEEHEKNGMPVRHRVSYHSYFPDQVVQRIKDQKAAAKFRRENPIRKRRKNVYRTVTEERWRSTQVK